MGVGEGGGNISSWRDLGKDQRKRQGLSLGLDSLLSPKTKRAGVSDLPGPCGVAERQQRGCPGALLGLSEPRYLCPRIFRAFSFAHNLHV